MISVFSKVSMVQVLNNYRICSRNVRAVDQILLEVVEMLVISFGTSGLF